MTIDPKNRQGLSRGEASFLEIIDRHGWHIMTVAGNDSNPIFSYSTGLFHSYGHPEVIVLGLGDCDNSQGVISAIGSQVKKGKAFNIDRLYDTILESYKCCFRPVLRDKYSDYMYWMDWFYERESVPVLQCLWPDRDGNFPVDQKCSRIVAEAQRGLFL
jgi:hypothetical protein